MSESHRHGGDWVIGAHVQGRGGLGVLGSEVPVGSLLYNDISLPSEANDEFRALVLTTPAGGVTTVAENSSLVGTGYPDGVHTGTYRGQKNAVTYAPDPATYTFTVGDVETGFNAAWARGANQTIGMS